MRSDLWPLCGDHDHNIVIGEDTAKPAWFQETHSDELLFVIIP